MTADFSDIKIAVEYKLIRVHRAYDSNIAVVQAVKYNKEIPDYSRISSLR